VTIEPDRVDPGLEGALVHLVGPVVVEGPPRDRLFDVAVSGPRLDRTVEMYQWRELRQEADDERFRHEKVWVEGRIPSEHFRAMLGHENPDAPPFASERFTADLVTIGRYAIGGSLIERLEADAAVPPGGNRTIEGVTLGARDGLLWAGTGAPGAPEIGDVRVFFTMVDAATLSVMGRLENGTIGDWKAANGETVAFARPEALDAATLLADARDEEWRLTWGLRFALTLSIFVGMWIVLRRIGRMIPWVGMLAARLLLPAAALLALAIGLVTIALGWLIFRPLLAASLVAVAAAVLVGLRWMRAGEGEPSLATPPPPPGRTPPPPGQTPPTPAG